ncbi:MAG: COX15/CtaA family protein [Planctomycetaceae bacterium]|nr:COX15/CtaA family protein [Planctomycetaceae bacterium]
MKTPHHNPWLHRFAVCTVCVAMITLVMGALVTTLNAGMAFRDWPTSDGQSMLTYPWLSDFSHDWDKFLEHGHRLAGMLIGVWSIALVTLVAKFEQRGWVKLVAVGVLIGVICQGILGGFRVWFDERGLAMLHGAFAACVFSLMAVVATVMSRRWRDATQLGQSQLTAVVPTMAVVTTIAIAAQYLLGGLVRHHGTGLHEHLGLGILTLLIVIANTIVASRSGISWLRWSSGLLLGVTLLQVSLGGAAWVTKFGLGMTGYVAVADSIQQIIFRTAHTIVGIIVFMTSMVHLVRAQRIAWVQRDRVVTTQVASLSQGVAAGGGAV